MTDAQITPKTPSRLAPPTRRERFAALFPNAPAFRVRQAEEATFRVDASGWTDVTNLPKEMTATLAAEVPWLSVTPSVVLSSSVGDAHKSALRLVDGPVIESVLMRNKRGQWTICISAQVGCAMSCAFCATGKLGFTRNLNEDEIVDQYRFWAGWLAGRNQKPETGDQGVETGDQMAETGGQSQEHQISDLRSLASSTRISNIVVMGMGEPLANYENMRAALNSILKHTDVGPTHVTVSTVGLLAGLDRLLDDPEWPETRLAISLHSADQITREEIMPTTHAKYLEMLGEWVRRYLVKFGNRRHHLTFEYVMLAGVNDTPRHADALAAFSAMAGHVKVNLIAYNWTDTGFTGSTEPTIEEFKARLEKRGVTVTVRHSMGQDIAAACGQLAAESGLSDEATK